MKTKENKNLYLSSKSEVWGVKRSGRMRGRHNRTESRLFTTS